MKPVCLAADKDGSVKVFPSHDPITLPRQGNLQMNISYQGDAVRVLFCKRCGVLYIDEHERIFSQSESGQPS